eukprot:3322552-Pleurochrysis_carterae.AAC.3
MTLLRPLLRFNPHFLDYQWLTSLHLSRPTVYCMTGRAFRQRCIQPRHRYSNLQCGIYSPSFARTSQTKRRSHRRARALTLRPTRTRTQLLALAHGQ